MTHQLIIREVPSRGKLGPSPLVLLGPNTDDSSQQRRDPITRWKGERAEERTVNGRADYFSIVFLIGPAAGAFMGYGNGPSAIPVGATAWPVPRGRQSSQQQHILLLNHSSWAMSTGRPGDHRACAGEGTTQCHSRPHRSPFGRGAPPADRGRSSTTLDNLSRG
jgi:hypothetical protein